MRSMCTQEESELLWSLYADVTKVKEKEFRATFEIKGKALYPKMDVLFSMMREILMESKLG